MFKINVTSFLNYLIFALFACALPAHGMMQQFTQKMNQKINNATNRVIVSCLENERTARMGLRMLDLRYWAKYKAGYSRPVIAMREYAKRPFRTGMKAAGLLAGYTALGFAVDVTKSKEPSMVGAIGETLVLKGMTRSFSKGLWVNCPYMDHNLAQRLIEPLVKNITKVDARSVSACLAAYPAGAQRLLDTAESQLAQIKDKRVVASILAYASFDEREKFEKKHGSWLIEKNILLRGVYKEPHEQNATEAHAAANKVQIMNNSSMAAFSTDKDLLAAYEQEEMYRNMALREGRETFVSGQHWSYQFALRLHKDLDALSNDRVKRDDHLFPFIRKPKTEREEVALRKKITAVGERSNSVIFMNYPMTGNASNNGSGSMHYYANNGTDWNNGSHVNPSMVFKTHDRMHLYEKYKSEIDQLAAMHKDLAKQHGNMLVVSIKDKYLKDLVVEVFAGGNKIANVDSERLADYRKKPRDGAEFILALTYDMALNPDFDGVSIREVNDTTVSDDPAMKARLHAFNEKYDDLMTKLKKDIKRERDLQRDV